MTIRIFLGALLLAAGSFGRPTDGALTAASKPATDPGTHPVAVGQMAPDFSLPDSTGHTVTLSASRGARPVLLVFYRGYW